MLSDIKACISAGYMIFEQFRFQSQLQLQAMQMLAFGFVAVGSFLSSGEYMKLFMDLAIFMPITGESGASSSGEPLYFL